MKEKHPCALGEAGGGGVSHVNLTDRKVRIKPVGLKTGDQSGEITLEMDGHNNYKEFPLCKCFSRCLRAKYIYIYN